MKIQFIRHATTLIWVNNKKILVDPLLGAKGTYTPIENVPNQNFNPLTPLPVPLEELLSCNAVLLTHLHRDHFDQKAMEVLPKHLPVFCQPQDYETLLSYGFSQVHSVENDFDWEGIHFYRTNGRHGYGAIALRMAPVSGFVIKAPNEPSLYILGDTVWCKCVQTALSTFKPDIVLSYCGKAQFAYGRPITMDEKGIAQVKAKAPQAKIVCVHMDAWNHCRLSKQDLKAYTQLHQIPDIIVPHEGEFAI